MMYFQSMPQNTGLLMRQARRSAGLTQVQAAELAGTTQAMIARYEHGSVSPTVTTLLRIMNALGQEVEIVIRESTFRPLSGPIGRRLSEHRREIRRLVSASGASNPRVFGSVARGQEHPQSDLDMLVDFPVRTRGLLPLAHLADEIARIVGVHVDIAASESLSPAVAVAALHDAVSL